MRIGHRHRACETNVDDIPEQTQYGECREPGDPPLPSCCLGNLLPERWFEGVTETGTCEVRTGEQELSPCRRSEHPTRNRDRPAKAGPPTSPDDRHETGEAEPDGERQVRERGGRRRRRCRPLCSPVGPIRRWWFRRQEPIRNTMSPVTGWPSAETTRYETTYTPSPRAGNDAVTTSGFPSGCVAAPISIGVESAMLNVTPPSPNSTGSSKSSNT